MTLDDFKKDLTGLERYDGPGGHFWYDPNKIAIEYLGNSISALAIMNTKHLSFPDGIESTNNLRLVCRDSLETVDYFPDSLTYMKSMFFYCCNLTRVSKMPKYVRKCGSLFYGCTRLSSIERLPYEIGSCDNMFSDCVNLREIDFNTESIQSAICMFEGCINLISIKGAPKSIANGTGMFNDCRALMDKYDTDDSEELTEIWLSQGFL
jgi:hypothetical protein